MIDTIEMDKLKKWTLGAGIFNVIAAFPLSMPFLYRQYYALFNSINSMFGLGGREVFPPAEGENMLFINTAGLALVLVGMLLIYASNNIRYRIGIPFLNAIVRMVFSFLLLYYIFTENILRILMVIGVIDIVIAISFFYHIYQINSKNELGLK